MIATFRAIREWWDARRRRIDMDILWPLCLEGAGNLEHAKAAFLTHCLADPAWQSLGANATIEFVDSLEAYD